MKVLFIRIGLFGILLAGAANLQAQQVKPNDKYNRQEVMITMRDGIKLHTIIFSPKGQTEKLPFLILRTPYGVNDNPSPEKQQYVKDMADDGYIFVFQDIRGRYLSEGKYAMMRFSRDKSI
ncbi:MAG: CocE/NonD family hydrolase, partial [Mucilaginibacter sp.]